jgi:hypothetical protein
MSSYSSIQYLYEANNGDEPVYNIDKTLFDYRYVEDNMAKFNKVFEPSSFFVNINRCVVRREDHNDVAKIIANNPQNPASTYNQLSLTDQFLTDVFQNEYSVQVSKSATVSDAPSILNNILASLPFKNDDNVSKSHEKMGTYMENIIKNTCLTNFKQAIQMFTSDRNSSDNTQVALTYIINKTDTLSIHSIADDLTHSIRSNMFILLNGILSTNNPIPTDLMSDFKYQGNTPLFHTPFYYNLRNLAANKMKFNSKIYNTSNTNVQYVIKKILVDTFIKTCYPLLQFDYITNMMLIYLKSGDFVNSRIALLAKAAFTYNFINYIYSLSSYNTNYNSQLMSDGATTYGDFRANVLGNLQSYISFMNNINQTDNSSHPITGIAKQLHKKSEQVVDQNLTVQEVKNDIDKNQLGMRNLIHNTDILKAKYNNTVRIFYFLLAVLIIMVILSAMLIIFKFNNYVLLLCGGIALIILLLQIIRSINAFLTNK